MADDSVAIGGPRGLRPPRGLQRHAQREVLAILLAITAAALPLAGAATAATYTFGGWGFYALSAGGEADLLSPALVIGALGIAVISDLGRWDLGRLRFFTFVCIGTGLLLTLVFFGSVVQIIRPSVGLTFTAGARSAAWGVSRVAALLALLAQVLLSLGITWFSLQLLSSERRRRP